MPKITHVHFVSHPPFWTLYSCTQSPSPFVYYRIWRVSNWTPVFQDLLEKCYFQAPNQRWSFTPLFLLHSHLLANSIGSTFKIYPEFGHLPCHHSGPSYTDFRLLVSLPASLSALLQSSPDSSQRAVCLKLVTSQLRTLQMSWLITCGPSPGPYGGFQSPTQSRPLAALLTRLAHSALATLASAVPEHTGHRPTSRSVHKLGNSSNSLRCFLTILSLCICHLSRTALPDHPR